MVTTFAPSTHKFTSPIRLFKANDPYFYGADNMPLAQLVENDLWLLDQITGGTENTASIDRSGFTELLPYVVGSDNTVRVKPGRFMARVNDASKPPILTPTRTTGDGLGELKFYSVPNYQINLLSAMSQVIAENALNFNGLLERALTFVIKSKNSDDAFPTTIPRYTDIDLIFHPFPLIQDWRTGIGGGFNQTLNSSKISFFFSRFIARWRGTIRTAVVDVPVELQVDVPPFDPQDYFYVSGGQIISIPGTQRIDLVFIYTHPIDATETKIQQYLGGGSTPTTITTPLLGILKGAGVGITQISNPNLPVIGSPADNVDFTGHTPVMIANESDTLVNNGFSGLGVHGSFPSPEDLLNLAPLLAESLQENDLQLIGQSVLPICYIVVKNTTPVDSNGNPVVTQDMIIDIRPFFRTAELTYSERTGIAGALPPISLANPVVGQTQMDEQMNAIKVYVDTRFNQAPPTRPSVISGGIIRGGIRYGVEGALLHQAGLIDFNSDNSLSALNQLEYFLTDIPNNSTFQNDVADAIPVQPEWDIADWLDTPPPIPFRNDYLHAVAVGYWNSVTNTPYRTVGFEAAGAGHFKGVPLYTDFPNANCNIVFVKKKITFGQLPPYLLNGGTYDINVKLQYTNRLSQTGFFRDTDESGQSHAIWVEKYNDHFIIYVAWPVGDLQQLLDTTLVTSAETGRNSLGYSTFMTTLDNPIWKSTGTGANRPLMGMATYPTVTWEMIGFPPGFFNSGQNSVISIS